MNNNFRGLFKTPFNFKGETMSVKSIFFKLSLKGSGIVNFDSNDQKFYWNQQDGISYASHDNVSFGKGNYIKDRDKDGKLNGKLKKILKISSDCLRHNIHIEGHPFHTVNILQNEEARISFLTHVDTLLRGYLLVDTMEKKKSCYTITSAENVSDATSSIELHSRSGAKEKRDIKDENPTADNSLFFKETVGDISYLAKGAVSIKELRFISMDDKFDRRALKDDSAKRYIECLAKTLGSKVSDPGYYVIKNSAYQVPEYGILLTDEQIKFLLTTLFEKMGCVSIGKSQTGYAIEDDLKFKVVQNPLTDKMDDTNWISKIDMKDISFDNPYEKVDAKAAVAQAQEVQDKVAQKKEEKAAKKKEKNEIKENAKKKAEDKKAA